MKNLIYLVLFSFLTGVNMYGQSPNWSVDDNNFEYTMSFVAFLNIDGNTLESKNDKIAALVNDEVRGATNLIYVPSKDRYYAYFNVFSNTNGEKVTFKVYDSTNDEIVDMPQTINFEINSHHGDLFQAYSVASPALSVKADLLSFNLINTKVLNMGVVNDKFTLYVANETNLADLNATFELSKGANLYIGSSLQISENNSIDFTKPVQCLVLSEDESQMREYTLMVNYNSSISDLQYLKKDSVCYNGGAIKVLLTGGGSQVVLLKEKQPYASQSINNGEVIFSNLEAATYTVIVSGISKDIIINLKD